MSEGKRRARGSLESVEVPQVAHLVRWLPRIQVLWVLVPSKAAHFSLKMAARGEMCCAESDQSCIHICTHINTQCDLYTLTEELTLGYSLSNQGCPMN